MGRPENSVKFPDIFRFLVILEELLEHVLVGGEHTRSTLEYNVPSTQRTGFFPQQFLLHNQAQASVCM